MSALVARLNSERTWRERGFPDAVREPYPRVVFAVNPHVGEINDAFLATPGGLGTVEPAWYRCVLPQEHLESLTPHRLSHSLEIAPSPLAGGGKAVAYLQLSLLERNAWIALLFDVNGNQVGRNVSDQYRLWAERIGLPNGDEFWLGELPPLLVDPLAGAAP